VPVATSPSIVPRSTGSHTNGSPVLDSDSPSLELPLSVDVAGGVDVLPSPVDESVPVAGSPVESPVSAVVIAVVVVSVVGDPSPPVAPVDVPSVSVPDPDTLSSAHPPAKRAAKRAANAKCRGIQAMRMRGG
jgi:hypothetical protein